MASKLTKKQLINNIRRMQETIARKVEAARVLAENNCFEEAQVCSVSAENECMKLRDIWEGINFMDADFE